MKKLLILICLFSMLLITETIQAQVVNKNHFIGVQLNPYMDSFFFEGTFIKPVFALRYGYNLNNHLSFGPEFSGYFVHGNSERADMNISNINMGAFARYSFLPEYRIRPFLEISSYYQLHHIKSDALQTREGTGVDIHNNSFAGYFSPGVTLFSKNQKFSLDLMYKFSDRGFVNGHKSAFSYRICYNF